jgi:competence protein ComEA
MRFLFPLTLASLVPFACLAGPVDINSADASTLAKELKGIGPARAEAIVAYRKQNGPFKSPDDLALVKGIAQKVIDENRSDIRLGNGKTEGAARSAAPPAPARPAG